MLVIGAVFLWTTTSIRTDIAADIIGPIAIPRILSLFLIIGGGLIVGRNVLGLLRGVPSPDTGQGDEPGPPASSRRAFAVMLLTMLYPLVMIPLGFLLATPLYVLAAFTVTGVRSRRALIGLPLLYAVGLYLVFDQAFRVNLPTGILLGPLRALGLER